MTRISAIATLFVLCSCASEWPAPPGIDFSAICEEQEDGSHHFFEVNTQPSVKYVKFTLYSAMHKKEEHSLNEISFEDGIQTWQLELTSTEASAITPGETTHFRCEDERTILFEVRRDKYTINFIQEVNEIDE